MANDTLLKTTKSPNGTLTLAFIDGPDDRWVWAVVTEYKGSQEYGDVLFAFDGDVVPTQAQVEVMLAALEQSSAPAQEPQNVTEEDAHARIVQAQIGAHVNASDTYLLALQGKLCLWLSNISAELARRMAKAPAYDPEQDDSTEF